MSVITAHFNWLDYLIVCLIGFSALISLFRGFIRELISLISWLGGLLLSLQFAADLAPFFIRVSDLPSVRYFFAFVLIFIAVVVAGIIFNAVVSKVLSITGFSIFDRLLGLLFGATRGAVIVAGLLLMFSHFASARDSAALTDSVVAPHFKPLVRWLSAYVPKNITGLTHWVQGEFFASEQKVSGERTRSMSID